MSKPTRRTTHRRIVFVDRDGTIIREPRDKQIDSLAKLEFVPGVIAGLRRLVEAGYSLVMVTNQDGLGTKRYPRRAFNLVQQKMIRTLQGEGVAFDAVLICPHLPREHCVCRKPKTTLVDRYVARHGVSLEGAFVFGDRETDVLLATALGIRAVQLTAKGDRRSEFSTPDALAACEYMVRAARSASVERRTTETKVRATVAIDGEGHNEIRTGLGFFDHMLAQLSKHSRIDMTIACDGDLEVDEHHTVEDVAIVLGQAIRRALGERRGIERYAFVVPMDESLASVALDLGGRGHLQYRCQLKRERVGELPCELVKHFFASFAESLGAGLHISCRGENAHHQIEAMFKAVARALGEACRRDPRARNTIASTKGTLSGAVP